ncbi:alkaline phosphatase, tissue-nonspecific isozyme-like [Asterias amurensis]|uniref:alkaline phosphatase, tissue-nonspecific isozyme-like n=1 Tax=Asterias amurensis TaxID=7602 RepID=UPI003AB22860
MYADLVITLFHTYNTDSQVPDSAGTATAYFSGVKTKTAVLGLDDSAIKGDCKSSLNANVESVMISAQKSGKSTGFVTTTRVTHATPAALYAHSPQRSWETDADIPDEEAAVGCTDIAQQLISLANNTNVILGGGRSKMLPNSESDPEYPFVKGSRKDGRNLIDEWLSGKDNASSRYVWNLDEFNKVDPVKTSHLLGLFETSHMNFESERLTDKAGEPSIAQMVEKATKILQRNEKGFFLMVEGGRIDHGNHMGKAYISLRETIAMEEAVSKAMELINEEDTLVIVTADHSHVLTLGGYPSKGNPILGLVDNKIGDDNLPFTTMHYASGPGGFSERRSYATTGKRRNLTNVDTEKPNFQQPALFGNFLETHGGEDVGIYANGPMSHLVHGVHEQSYIAHVVRYAACLDYKEHCQTRRHDYLRALYPVTHPNPSPLNEACDVGNALGSPQTTLLAVCLAVFISVL